MREIEYPELRGYEGHMEYRPEVEILQTPDEVDLAAWKVFEAQIRNKPNSVLTLATGSSPIGLYKLWIDAFQKGTIDCSQLITKNLDENWPLPPGHKSSYDTFMRNNLFDYINIPEAQRFIPNSAAKDPHEEAKRYQAIIDSIGPSDLALLGIGPKLTCHIGFNERGSSLSSHTRFVSIDPDTVAANAMFFDNPEEVTSQAITQGISEILTSHQIILIAKGSAKAQGIQRALQGQIGPDSPASFLRLHPNVTFIIDREAASLLTLQK